MDAELIRIGALSAVAVWGITQAIKPAIKRYAAGSFTRTAIRLACLAAGCLWGFVLKGDGYGVAAGCGGAALSAVVVAAIKAKINDGRRKLN